MENSVLMKKPGEIPNRLGVYIEVNEDGIPVYNARYMTVRKETGKTPPTQAKNRRWKWLHY